MRAPRILIIDDEQSFREFLAEALRASDYSVSTAATAHSGLQHAKQESPDVVLLDQNLPDRSGLDILTDLRKLPGAPIVIVMTAFAATPSAVSAIKSGAYHYLTKPFEFSDLLNLLSEVDLNHSIGMEDEPEPLSHLIGWCSRMVELKRQIVRVARSPVSNVLIYGESGTGKELIARAVHDLSNRSSQPLVSVNCAALTDSLLMSELFGHERGAFTDARERRKGVFEAADGGTLFLDEIGEMGLRAQAALLRVLEQRNVVRVGGSVEIPVDVRLVAATNRSLGDMVGEGSFREDLFFRLNVVQLCPPPLRKRGADIRRLAERFSSMIASRYEEPERVLSEEAESLFFAYHWPGNVRELRNAIERAYIIGSGPELRISDLPLTVQSHDRYRSHPDIRFRRTDLDDGIGFVESKQNVIDQFEYSYLQSLLARHDGNITQAAEEAGVLRQVLQRLLKRHGIRRNDFRTTPSLENAAAS